MDKRLTWLRREEMCGSGKSCAGEARHANLPGGTIIQGYLIHDRDVLADLGTVPTGEGFLFVPDGMREV